MCVNLKQLNQTNNKVNLFLVFSLRADTQNSKCLFFGGSGVPHKYISRQIDKSIFFFYKLVSGDQIE